MIQDKIRNAYHDIGNLLGELRKTGASVRMHGQALDEVAADPHKLEDNLRQFSVIKNPQVIKDILQAKLDIIQGKKLPVGMDQQGTEGLFNALFDQEKFWPNILHDVNFKT